jgi:hypothetical protein
LLDVKLVVHHVTGKIYKVQVSAFERSMIIMLYPLDFNRLGTSKFSRTLKLPS